MNGSSGKRLIPIALMIAITAQTFPVLSSGWLNGLSFAKSKAALENMDLKPSVKMPPMPEVVSPSKQDPLKSLKSETPIAKESVSSAFAMQELDESDRHPVQKTKALQGSITSIHVTRGRSQIVKFAQPIMRLSIAEPTVADIVPLSPDQIMINGRLRGVTSLIVWDENGQEGIFDLYVQNDTSELLDAVNSVAPQEKIQARVTDDSFILSGQVSSSVVLEEIRKTAAAYGFRDDKFIDLTDTPVPQVMLQVRIAEVNRSTLRSFKNGFSFSASSPTALGAFSRFDTLGASANAQATPLQIGALPPIINPSVGGLTTALVKQIGSVSLGSRLDMLETSGQVNTLASPTLVCTHGRSANFLAGGEFPFVGSVDQNGSPVIQYREFGVKLNFTPWIAIRSGRIEIKVAPEVSSLDTSNCVSAAAGGKVCGILKRSTETTVELQDGETLFISGILSREEQNTFSQVPFIANVPILGNMFKNPDMKRADRELVVVITPHIVKASDYGKVLGTVQ